ncbi:uncharacterized protein ARMOST_02296 [Armillaria ostoyae]|uniref:Uncharacterized protein n=1 Tax=Armillaria ostoyae TaxID=47428 RepID=A0A284QRC6_ARMOS|nr:uncharacterized protein ARMOST_02296 [Armillaria ostoyae]
MPNTVPGLTFRTLPRFDASSPTASLVSSILQSANCPLVGGPVGNTFTILSNTLPTSIDTAPPAPMQSSDARKHIIRFHRFGTTVNFY